MKTPMFFLMAVCTALSYAQTGSEMSATNKSIAISNTQVMPYPLEVTYDKTTHLIFPSAIRYVDLGSENIIADKAKEAENVLRVKASVINFDQKTNLSVITEEVAFSVSRCVIILHRSCLPWILPEIFRKATALSQIYCFLIQVGNRLRWLR